MGDGLILYFKKHKLRNGFGLGFILFFRHCCFIAIIYVKQMFPATFPTSRSPILGLHQATAGGTEEH